MPERAARRNLAVMAELRVSLAASGVIGTWEWDLLNRCVYYDEGGARLLLNDRNLAGHPMRGEAAIAAVHPEDRAYLLSNMVRTAQSGSLFLAEYRVVSQDSALRWVLCRGRIYRDENGQAVRGRGMMLDITESREAGEGYVARPPSFGETPLLTAADHCIAAHAALEQHGSARLRQKSSELLWEVGHEIARASLQEEQAAPYDGRTKLH